MHAALERCRQGLRRTLSGLSPEDAERVLDGKWSIAAIVEHLDLTYSQNVLGLERRLQKGVPAERTQTLRQRVNRFIVTRVGYFPAGRTSPEAVRPRGRRFVELSIVIDPHLLVLDQRLKDVARAFGPRTPVLNHPIMGPFSVNDWRRFHWVHTRHHLRQIELRAKGIGQRANGALRDA